MGKTAIVYWSGTGNTEAMAEAVAEGARAAGAQVELFASADFNAAMMDDYDGIAFGCPSMGAEQLEEMDFEPLFVSCEQKLKGKKIALFGSYGWGDGEWMRDWRKRCDEQGAILSADPVICNGFPDDSAKTECRELGKSLAR